MRGAAGFGGEMAVLIMIRQTLRFCPYCLPRSFRQLTDNSKTFSDGMGLLVLKSSFFGTKMNFLIPINPCHH